MRIHQYLFVIVSCRPFSENAGSRPLYEENAPKGTVQIYQARYFHQFYLFEFWEHEQHDATSSFTVAIDDPPWLSILYYIATISVW